MLGNDIDLRLVGMIDVCEIGSEFALGAVPQVCTPGERDMLQAQVIEWLASHPHAQRVGSPAGIDGCPHLRTVPALHRQRGRRTSTDGPDISSREHTFWILIDNALIFRRHKMLPHDCPIHSWTAEDSLHRGLNLIDWRQYSRFANPAEIIAGTTHSPRDRLQRVPQPLRPPDQRGGRGHRNRRHSTPAADAQLKQPPRLRTDCILQGNTTTMSEASRTRTSDASILSIWRESASAPSTSASPRSSTACPSSTNGSSNDAPGSTGTPA